MMVSLPAASRCAMECFIRVVEALRTNLKTNGKTIRLCLPLGRILTGKCEL